MRGSNMSIEDMDHDGLSDRGRKDASRHRQKIDNIIRKNIRNVISEESIISKRDSRTIKIPVKGLKDYKFIYGTDNDDVQGGIGQGDGKPGDVIARRIKNSGNKPDGSDPGDDVIETEVDIDYIIQIMFEDLGLPYIEEKTQATQLVPTGWKFENISKVGILPRLHKNRTIKESIRRMIVFANEVCEEASCIQDIALRALIQTDCDINEAIQIVKNNQVDMTIEPNILIDSDDLRYKQIDDAYEIQSNAVVIAVMDVSGSMTTTKKYYVRSLLFWLVEFLRKTYSSVEIRFITHTTEAKLVDEDEFFHKKESGGTKIHTGIDLADYTFMTEYPIEKWNRFCFVASDGEDWDPDETISSIKKILANKLNMFSYCEVEDSDGSVMSSSETLFDHLVVGEDDFFDFDETKGDQFFKDSEKHIFTCKINKKEDIWESLKFLLFKREKK